MFSKYVDSVFDFGFKNSNERTSKITKITPHHMASVMGGISCARMHYNSDNASANYYIGVQGEIVGGVAEERRAWTSGNRENDYSAITIEVSNEVLNGEWKISDTCYKSLVRLCADICERYNIIPKYNGNDSGSITVHRMFQPTECPGEYLMHIIESGKFERDILEAMGKIEETEPVEVTSDFDYEIQKGDTLSSISRKFNTSVKFLKDLNKIENADKINSGDIIQTGFLYEVEKGDTLTSISKKFGTTIKHLTANNNLENPDKIFIGQWLVIR